MYNQRSLSTTEIVGAAVTAGVVLGTAVVGFKRARREPTMQEKLMQTLSSAGEAQKARGLGIASQAMESLSSAYPDWKAHADDLLTKAAKQRKPVKKQAKRASEDAHDKIDSFRGVLTDEIIPAAGSIVAGLLSSAADVKQSAVPQVQESLRQTSQRVLEHAPEHPIQSAGESISTLLERADDQRGRAVVAAGELKTTAAETAGAAVDTTTRAAKDTAAAAIWLTLGLALVYWFLFDERRREQVKSFLGTASETTLGFLAAYQSAGDDI